MVADLFTSFMDMALWIVIVLVVVVLVAIVAHKLGKDKVLPDEWERKLDRYVGEPWVSDEEEEVNSPKSLAAAYIDRDDFMKAIGALKLTRSVQVDDKLVHYGSEPPFCYHTWPNGEIKRHPPGKPDGSAA